MASSGPRLSTAFCLFLCFCPALGGLLPRTDPAPTITAVPLTTALSTSDGGSQPTTSTTPHASSAAATPSSVHVSSTSTTISSVSPLPTVINGTGSLNETLFNTTIPAGQLPLQPRVTPGWGVAGAILLVCGAVYTLIGMKKQWLHTFFSTAFLAGLSTAVLVVYVMPVPVRDAIQGAYVVAVVCTGLVLGGAALVFKELTECLGCVLGGFSLSMWLLTLRGGGLLRSTGGKAVFIACFSAGTLAFYFSRFTRQYALIVSVAFGGATATVLGIDCFSRAGLKEFWVYIWDLNDNLFPLGTVTYPITKGIRVELAATIVVFLAGIVSQLKLWKVVQERRAKRDAARAQSQQQLDEEDAQVGRQVEEANARERGQWEAAYGEGERGVGGPHSSADSGVGDVGYEKSLRRNSHGTVTAVARRDSAAEDPIEMAELSSSDQVPTVSPRPRAAAETVMGKSEKDGAVTVRVAVDEWPNGEMPPAAEKTTWVVGADGEARRVSESPRQSMTRKLVSPAPSIVPLPFRVPEGGDEGRDDDERSSAATCADYDDGENAAGAQSNRGSPAKRLSVNSTDLLRRLSRRSSGRPAELQRSPHGESEEELVVPKADNGDSESVAATIDGMSSVEDDGLASVPGTGRPGSVEIKAVLSEQGLGDGPGGTERDSSPLPTPAAVAVTTGGTGVSPSETKSTGAAAAAARRADDPIDVAAAAEAADTLDEASTRNERNEGGSVAGDKRARSVASAASHAASLTKERLPPPLPRVALSYRTNEWAKHLSNADAPELEDLALNRHAGAPAEEKQEEAPVPVKVEELQQTAETGAPPPALPRSAASASRLPASHAAPARSPSHASIGPSLSAGSAAAQAARHSLNPPSPTNSVPAPFARPARGASHLIAEPIAEEGDGEAGGGSSARSISSGRGSLGTPPSDYEPAFPVRPAAPGAVSYASPQTLLGRREMLLRRVSSDPRSSSVQGLAGPPASGLDAGGASYPVYAAGLGGADAGVDADDLPLSQRRELIRQSSMLGSRASSTSMSPMAAAAFDSHQPQRSAALPAPGAREARLASFRQSVATDLRAGAGRETPLPPPGGGGPASPAGVRQAIDAQRSLLMGRKEAEAQRREMERAQREAADRAFEERMRRGDLLDAHREAMRRMQMGARSS